MSTIRLNNVLFYFLYQHKFKVSIGVSIVVPLTMKESNIRSKIPHHTKKVMILTFAWFNVLFNISMEKLWYFSKFHPIFSFLFFLLFFSPWYNNGIFFTLVYSFFFFLFVPSSNRSLSRKNSQGIWTINLLYMHLSTQW